MNCENQNIEYKETWRDEYLKWICGFANAQGGILYIGIDDKGEVIGVEDAQRLAEDIPNKVRDVLGIVVEVNLEHNNGLDYIEIRTEPSSFPISYKGEYHIRSGSTKQQLRGNALTQFLLRKTGLSWDATEVNNIDSSDLSPVAFDIFRTESVRRKRMDKLDVDIPDKDLLEKLHLFTEDGKLTKAGFLLFACDPEKRIIGSTICNSIAHRAYNYMNPTQIRVYEDKLVISNDASVMNEWSAEKLMESHKSIKYNPLIANTLFKAGFIEAWGRGIEKMCNSCMENGNPLPQFLISENDVTIVFESNVVEKVPEKVLKERMQLTDRQIQILKRLVETANGNVVENVVENAKSLAIYFNITERTIQRDLAVLQENGLISHDGPDKGGKWKIIVKQ